MVVLNEFILSIPYGILIVGSGVYGWSAGGSMTSLIMGGSIGILLVIFGALGYMDWAQHPRPAPLYILTLTLLSGILTLTMWFRFFKTHHFFPAGFLGCISTLFTFFFISNWLLSRPKKKNK